VLVHQQRRGEYHDSVVLMQLQRGLASLPGIEDAGVVMATSANLELLRESDLLPGDLAAAPEDLVVVVRSRDESSGRAALDQVETLLRRRPGRSVSAYYPHSLGTALRQMPDASWVLISVPGRFASTVAREALGENCNVFLYSDNVPIGEEISLKEQAWKSGLMVMGPDCGTAIIHGIGLGFANRVRGGPIGLVGASGTGLQAVTSLLHSLGSGVSQAFGTGSRDLHADVAGRTFRQALGFLAQDPNTRAICLISKPPDPQVSAGILGLARSLGKPVVVFFLGYPPPGRRIGNLHFATSLEETARRAVELAVAGSTRDTLRVAGDSTDGKFVRGLFSGGTLAYEVVQALQSLAAPVFSNTPLRESQRLEDPLHSRAHTILDMGDDRFTVGRLHPMLDHDLRLRRLRQEAKDAEVGVALLDVVLGEGAHPDPAAEIAPVLEEIRRARPGLAIGVLLVGTDEDPQDLAGQRSRLEASGATVLDTVARTVEFALQHIGGEAIEAAPPLRRLDPPLRAINIGLESFHDSLQAQQAPSIHVHWRPPAGGDERLLSILAKMKG
jgi:FdrA protein